MKWILLLLITFTINSCINKENKRTTIIKEYFNKQIIFPPLKAKIMGQDTSCFNLLKNKKKILVYIDSTGCTSCKLHLLEWHNWISKNKTNKNLSFIFILSLKDYTEFEWIQKINQFDYPVFYDLLDEFCQINSIPKDEIFHTFLLDENNRIIAIGNPIVNKKMQCLYKKFISEPS